MVSLSLNCRCSCLHNQTNLYFCLFVVFLSSRAEERHEGVEGCLEGTIKLGDGQGDLKLGKLRQHYIEDADLRKILAETILDPNKMKNFDRHALLLITSVIYSEKFELKGKRLVKVSI